jgi:putative flippase GtrA
MPIIKFLIEHIFIRYVISGGTSASVNLAVLYIFKYKLHFYYLTASRIAFIVGFFVSLILHKFFTFRDHSTENIHKQTAMYLMSSLFGLSLNTTLMYVFVDILNIWIMFSQVLAGILVASCTFFISKHIVFKK